VDECKPLVGGHAGITILPLLSQAYPAVDFTADEVGRCRLAL
jgi:malate dehydrogenase